MRTDDERLRLPGNSARLGTAVTTLLGRALAFATGAALLVVAFMFSLVVFAVLLTAGLVFVAYLWWKTRELRRQLRERPPGGHVIEGETIRHADVIGDDRR